MRRRQFLTSCASGLAAATVTPVAVAQLRKTSGSERALSTLQAAKEQQIAGNFEGLQKSFHAEALLVEPGTLKPLAGRATILDALRKSGQERKLLYFYYRQPQFLEVGNNVLVISNYEAGYQSSGETVEETGKSSNVVQTAAGQSLIALEMQVPNLYAGAYGALGTALTSRHLGVFPMRALGGGETSEAGSAGGGEKDTLYSTVQRIDSAWVTGNPGEILKNASKSGVFLIGDYSPFYIAGAQAVKEHFADFYKTSKVKSLKEQDPLVQVWGNVAAVYFDFDLDYNLGGKSRRSPGRAVYTFTKSGGPGGTWVMAACAASHLVLRNVGDPYPLAAGPS
jgi:hypothetical protein